MSLANYEKLSSMSSNLTDSEENSEEIFQDVIGRKSDKYKKKLIESQKKIEKLKKKNIKELENLKKKKTKNDLKKDSTNDNFNNCNINFGDYLGESHNKVKYIKVYELNGMKVAILSEYYKNKDGSSALKASKDSIALNKEQFHQLSKVITKIETELA
jgi:hypothetical protein